MTNLTGPEWDTGKDCGDSCGNNTLIAANSKPYKHLFEQKPSGEKKGTLLFDAIL